MDISWVLFVVMYVLTRIIIKLRESITTKTCCICGRSHHWCTYEIHFCEDCHKSVGFVDILHQIVEEWERNTVDLHGIMPKGICPACKRCCDLNRDDYTIMPHQIGSGYACPGSGQKAIYWNGPGKPPNS